MSILCTEQTITKNLFPAICQMNNCKYKLKLTDFSCKCEKKFCSKHRYAEDHNCRYNYQKNNNIMLNTNLVKVVADKLENKI